MLFRQNVIQAKCLLDEMSFWRNAFTGRRNVMDPHDIWFTVCVQGEDDLIEF